MTLAKCIKVFSLASGNHCGLRVCEARILATHSPTPAVHDVDVFMCTAWLDFVKSQCSETGTTEVQFLWPIFNGGIRIRRMIWSACSSPLTIWGI